MKCICPHCGEIHASGDLCFDFSKILEARLSEELERVKDRLNDENYKTTFEKLSAIWKRGDAGSPFRLKESDLVKWITVVKQGSTDSMDGTLTLTADDWLKCLETWRCKKEDLPTDAMPLVDKLLSRSVNLPEILLRTKVVLLRSAFQDGPDAVRITGIRLENLRFLQGSMLLDERFCPDCGGRLSRWAGRFPEVVLTVLGGPRISKSSALAACANFFTKNTQNNYGIYWEVDDADSSWIQFEEESLKPYRKNEETKPTNVLVNAPAPRFSVLVHLTPKSGVDTRIVLTVVDLPGELFNPASATFNVLLDRYRTLYRNIDCIWYCTDYAEMANLPPEERKKYGYSKPPLTSAELLGIHANIKGLFRDNVPTACILGKSDLILSDLTGKSAKLKPLFYRPDYSLGDDETRKWIEVYDKRCPRILGSGFYDKAYQVRDFLFSKSRVIMNSFESAFPAHTYIATSNYGHGFADDSEKSAEPRPRPFQVEVPFLWTLAALGYLEVKSKHKRLFRSPYIQKDRADGKNQTWRNLCMCGNAKDSYVQGR